MSKPGWCSDCLRPVAALPSLPFTARSAASQAIDQLHDSEMDICEHRLEIAEARGLREMARRREEHTERHKSTVDDVDRDERLALSQIKQAHIEDSIVEEDECAAEEDAIRDVLNATWEEGEADQEELQEEMMKDAHEEVAEEETDALAFENEVRGAAGGGQCKPCHAIQPCPIAAPVHLPASNRPGIPY